MVITNIKNRKIARYYIIKLIITKFIRQGRIYEY